MIEKEARRATSLDTVLDDQQSYYDDDFYPTQLRILESRRLAQQVTSRGTAGRRAGARRADGAGQPAVVQRPIIRGRLRVGVEPHGRTEAHRAARGRRNDRRAEPHQQLSGGPDRVSQPIRTTRIFEISYQAPDPVYAERAANALASEYIAQSKDIRSEATQEATDYLSKELDAQRVKLNDSEAKLAQYKETHDAVGLDDKVNTVSTKLADISGSLTHATLERIDKGAAYEGLKAIQGDREKLAAHPLILSNPDIQRLKVALNQLQAKRAEILAGHGEIPRHGPRPEPGGRRAGEAQSSGRPRGGSGEDRIRSREGARGLVQGPVQSAEPADVEPRPEGRRVREPAARRSEQQDAL